MEFIQRLIPKSATNPSITVQILSDLHLELGQQYLSYSFPATAPFLILAGDIGRLVDYDGYLGFLHAQVARYEKVFLVLGNHEFFGLGYESALEKAQQLTQESSLSDKVVLLHKASWDDPQSGVRILGCTLWSAVPTDAYEVVEAKVNDFRKISEWSVHRHNAAHAQEVAWLRAQVEANANRRRLLVVTHHAPCIEGTSRPEQTSNPWTSAFATDLIDREWEGVQAWVFGHTHYSTDFVRCGTRVIANQRGYVLPGSSTANGEQGKQNRTPVSFDSGLSITL
jgi:Icc-related predicted phosphoesterase